MAGKSLQQAEAALRAAGLTVSSTTKPVGVNGTVVLNSVAGTVPPAGTSWPQNQPVTIEVVAGLALPNLVGQDVNAIQQWAGSNNIQLQPTTVQSNQPQGIIVSQSVAPGTPVPPGATVSVSVSDGPPEVQIPGNLIGQHFQQVQQTLTRARLQGGRPAAERLRPEGHQHQPVGPGPGRQHDHRDLRRIRRVLLTPRWD